MKCKEIKERLNEAECYVDQVTLNKGVVTVRRGFFYTHGRTAEGLKNEVFKAFPDAEVVDCGQVWKSFRGGASVASQSHWFVKFKVPIGETVFREETAEQELRR